MDRRRIVYLLLISVTIGITLTGFYLNRSFYHDDAFISLRYAYNLIHGNGLTWNPMERVEGYSNFLYIILVSLLGNTGLDLVVSSKVVNISAFITLIVFMWLYLRGIADNKEGLNNLNYIPLILTITSFPLIIWTLGGLEGPLFTLLCTMGIWLISDTINGKGSLSSVIISGIAFSLSLMTRPDGIIFVLITFIFFLYLSFTEKGIDYKILLIFSGTLFLIFMPYFLWRINYFGQILPNTYYAKASNHDLDTVISGITYVLYYWTTPPYIFPILAIVIQYSILKGNWDRRMSYLSSIIAGYFVYIVYIGGDHMPAYRFVLPIIPSSLLLLYLGLRPFARHLYGWRAPVFYLNLLLLVSFQIIHPGRNRMDLAAFLGKIVGEYISQTWPEGSLIALNTAGSTPYFAPKNRYIDMLGLNDPHIARRKIVKRKLPWQSVPGHLKGDGLYVLSREPDYIIVGPANGTEIDNPMFLSDLEMMQETKFLNLYEVHAVRINIVHVSGYKDYLVTLPGELIFTYYKRKKNNEE